jgi:hypothetical protein
VTKADYDAQLPRLDEAIATHGKINLLIAVEDFDFKSFDAAKADFEFGTHQYCQVEKAAFVSDMKWMERMVKIIDPFTRRVEEKNFGTDQMEEAWAWVLAGD